MVAASGSPLTQVVFKFNFYAFERCACVYVYVLLAFVVPTGSQERFQVSWNGGYRQCEPPMLALETEPESSGKAASVLNF